MQALQPRKINYAKQERIALAKSSTILTNLASARGSMVSQEDQGANAVPHQYSGLLTNLKRHMPRSQKTNRLIDSLFKKYLKSF